MKPPQVRVPPARSAVFEPLSAHSTYEEAVARLGTAVRIGLLAPGTRLPPERELAEQLGISRSTLRQALSTLTESGHLVAVRGRTGGTFVAASPPIASREPFPLERWRELLDWRVAIELGAVQLAAERAGDDDVTRLREALAGLERTVDSDYPTYRRADIALHLAVAEASGSRRVVAAMTGIHGDVSDLLDRIAYPSPARHHANEQHGRIITAVEAHDAPAAVASMREHIDGTEQILAGLLP